ncbi:GHKL domain-containing protein [Lederbergia sp. NSJ-179]|uniref:sensor histidine kinase n=1 Tax=Lederbergia sp. NSJ-179 TaxID=2931402 RepID=UPI001FD0D729|nr:sensor histidine kinase [Lederbergia sp. NSJ-179]MCJ7839338.1 GHKL domain-containing protein [Lederbergia sp. NSJ-179]
MIALRTFKSLLSGKRLRPYLATTYFERKAYRTMIFSFFFFVVELFALFGALFYTLKIPANIQRVVVGILVIGVPAVLCYLYVIKWVGFVYLLVSLICVFYAYTKKIRVLLDVCIFAIACIISETLAQVIKFSVFSEETAPVMGISAIIFLVFFALSIYIYQLFIRKIWNSIAISVASQLLFIVIAFITVAVLTLNLFISLSLNLYTSAMFNLLIQTIYFVLMFVLSFLLLRNNKKENRLRRKEMEQEQLLHYMQELERINKDMQGFRHDYQNILLTMQGYIDQNDFKGLKAYFHDRIVKVENRTIQSNYILNQLDHIKLVELKGLLSTKVLVAEERGIDIHVEVPDVIQAIEMNMIDLTRMIGILMDNAIEASAKLEERELNVAFLQTDVSVLIIFENRVNHESIQIERLFEAGFSTKGKDHGLGLAIVRKILNRYPNITMNTRIENGFFIHEIEINEVIRKKYVSTFYPKKTMA